MARHIGGFKQSLLGLSVLAVLAGCGGPPVTQNALPAGSSGPSGNNPIPSNPNPSNPGPNNPGPNNPSTPNPGLVGEFATANANSAVLTTTRTMVYNLNTALLGANGWRPAAPLEHDDTTVAISPQVAFDASGNGFAVWIQGGDVLMSRYTATSASWSAALALDEGIDTAHQPLIAVDRDSGDAIATWTQSDGVAESIYAARFDASSNSWSAPETLESSANEVDANPANAAVSISGSHAAVAWIQSDGTHANIYLSRLVAGSWTAPALIDANDQAGEQPGVAIDSNGNAIVVWRQRDPTYGDGRINSRRWDNTTQTLGAVVQLNINGDRLPEIQFDAQGNGIAIWSGGGLYSSRFDVTSGQWSSEVTLHNQVGNAWNAQLSLDAAGNALAVWVESDGTAESLYARRYNAAAGTWGNASLLETGNVNVSIDEAPTVSLSGGEGVVAWIQDGPTKDVYARKLNAGTWEAATLLETYGGAGMGLVSTVDAAGNAAVLWVQADSFPRSIIEARYLTSNVVVPAGGTWQSIANTLYGANSVEAGLALQAAMGGGAISEGMILSGFPATLTVTEAVPAYYTVLATDTWAHIAQTVYGVTDVAAITQLQTLLGNPTLAAGLQLVVPTTVQYTTSADYLAPLDWTRVVTTTTTYHQLDANQMTVPLENWSTAAALDTNDIAATSPQVAFGANGNGIAVWAQGDDMVARRYVASTGLWSAPVVLDSNPNEVTMPRVALDRASGNAVVSWLQSDGVADSVYVSSFNAGNNSWSGAQLMETNNNPVPSSPAHSQIAISGEHAAVIWLQAGATANNDLYMSRLVAGTWTTPVVVDTRAEPALSPEVAIDPNGNVVAAWRQLDATAGQYFVYARRWDNTAQAFAAVNTISFNGDRIPRVGLDAEGNAVMIWRGGTGDGVFARHYNVTTDQWGPELQLQTTPGAARSGELSVDESGDALVTWWESIGGVGRVYVRRYDAAAGTWGAATPIAENLTADYMTVSLVGNSGVVGLVTEEDSGADVYALAMRDGEWGAATQLDTLPTRARDVASNLDDAGNATVVWVQVDTALSIQHSRSNTTPYYLVPAAATWQSLANTLYGIDSEAAADALETALGSPALSNGLHLEDLPATLVVTPPVPTHYVVQSGDTWQSITLTLYGTSRSEAATALWDQLGRPTLTVGQSLIIPSALAYTIEEE